LLDKGVQLPREEFDEVMREFEKEIAENSFDGLDEELLTRLQESLDDWSVKKGRVVGERVWDRFVKLHKEGRLVLTKSLAEALLESEDTGEKAEYLADNPGISKDLAKLPAQDVASRLNLCKKVSENSFFI